MKVVHADLDEVGTDNSQKVSLLIYQLQEIPASECRFPSFGYEYDTNEGQWMLVE